jgi:uncharacterized protein (TIGR03067 family)/predicted Zn finger-like uncharacterized protein
MASVSIPCPSCEAGFAVKDSLIGKKVDCPKCKYRFKAEMPDDGDDTPRSKKSDKTKKKSGNNTLVIGGIIGALALILLVVGGYMLFAGGDNPDTAKKTNTTPNRQPTPGNTGSNDGGGESKEGTGEGDAGKTNEGTTASGDPVKPKGINPNDLKNVTNLLPGESIAVYKVFVDRVIQTPFYNALFDKATQDFFRNSLTFEAGDIESYHHCIINPDRMPFGVFRLKKPLDEQLLLNRLENVKGPNSPIRGRHYNTIKSNPFLDAVGRALSNETLRNETGIPVTEEDKKKWGENKPLAFCVYDVQTLIIADQLELERFLNDLDDKGDPPMKSIYNPDAPPTESTPASPGGEGGEGGAPMRPGQLQPGRPGEAGVGMAVPHDPWIVRTMQRRGPPGGAGGEPPQGQIGGEGQRRPGGQPGGAPAQPRRSYTSNPNYRTVDEQLKFMLNRLEDEDPNNPPAIIYAEILDQRIFNQRVMSAIFRETGDALFGLLSQIKVVGAAIRVLNKDKLLANASFEFQNDSDARSATSRFIQPILEQVTPLLSLVFGTPIEIRNNTSGGGGGGPRGGGGFGAPPPGFEGGPGAPGGAPPPGVSGGDQRGVSGRPRGGAGPGSPDGGGDGGFGGQPGGGSTSPSNITVSLVDKATILNLEILWNEERYKKTILPLIVTAANQLKGRMSVLSGETTWHNLAAAFPKLKSGNKPFPRGTMEREIKSERYGLAFPPEQRVSFLAELLPFIGRGSLRNQIEPKKFPWYAKENVAAAESWVPEFLVPYYPQTSWRASHPLAEGKVLGGTNFVGLSGLGLDSARYNPTNPEHAKKVGITGYDWGSTPAEISDGMANTIYMIQAPPGIRRPWIAGGGATVVGVDDTIANPVQDFVHTTPDKKRGTYLLMADGSVRWMSESIDPKIFKGMATRAGGETLGDIDKLMPKVDPPKGTKVDLRGSGSAAPGTGTKPAASDGDKVDAAELKKFDGDWKVTMLVAKGKRLPTEDIQASGLVMKIEGDLVRLEGNPGAAVPKKMGRIVGLNIQKNPREMTIENLDGSDKGKTEISIYEFVGPLKLKMRIAEGGKPSPKQMRIPEEGSSDAYMEFEKVNPE